MTPRVRALTAADRAGWQRLFLDYGFFYETSFDERVLDGVWTWLLDATHEVSALVAVSETGELVGFAHYRRLADTFTASTGWFLDDLYVAPDARGTGAATALIEAVTERAREGGGGTLRWITAEDNTAARRLYDRVATRATWVTYEKEID